MSAVLLFIFDDLSLAQGVIRQLALAHYQPVKANFLTQDPFQYLLFVWTAFHPTCAVLVRGAHLESHSLFVNVLD